MTPATDEELGEVRRLLEKATPGDLTTAERHEAGDHYECPACGGEGELSAETYTNFDGRALGVQFFGIGPEFVSHQMLWHAMLDALPRILSRLESERAAGWRDALSCVQYTAANRIPYAKSEAEAQAYTEARKDLVDELVEAEPSDWLKTEWRSAQDWMGKLSDAEARLESEREGRESADKALRVANAALKNADTNKLFAMNTALAAICAHFATHTGEGNE